MFLQRLQLITIIIFINGWRKGCADLMPTALVLKELVTVKFYQDRLDGFDDLDLENIISLIASS